MLRPPSENRQVLGSRGRFFAIFSQKVAPDSAMASDYRGRACMLR